MVDHIRVTNRENNKEHVIGLNGKIREVSIGYNPKMNTDNLRINYSTPKVAPIIYDYNMETKEKVEVKKSKVYPFIWHKGINVERIWATAKDGTQIPITIMHNRRNKWMKDSTNIKRVYMSSYGSYGSSSRLGYDPAALALVKRGFIYAVPHVRGGSELGKHWYEDGKMLHKKNTFTDFIDCAEYLVNIGYATKGQITAQGGSAGGLLMGAITNMRPDLFKTIVLDVPFVDVVNTMMDDQLPLTTSEYEEWGNPNIKKQFKYMLSYSPYDNVKAQNYPNMLFYTGLNDTRVGYWEAAKMVAKLRKMKTDDNVLLLHTNISAGHGGGSGRLQYYSELAQKYALIFEMYKKDTQ